MKITDVRLSLVDSESALKAIGSITIEEAFVVHGIRVVDSEKGLFVAMPSRKLANGEFRDVAHPLNTETRDLITDKVLKAYDELLKNA